MNPFYLSDSFWNSYSKRIWSVQNKIKKKNSVAVEPNIRIWTTPVVSFLVAEDTRGL